MQQTTETKPPPLLSVPAPALGAWLVFAAGKVVRDPRVFGLDTPTISIGRAAADITVPDDTRMSRRHATIHTGVAGRMSIVDHESRNGTAVNGKRVTDSVLKAGDILSCGDSCLVIAELAAGVQDAAVDGLLGDSAAMRRLRATIELFAPNTGTVLIQAETGCGKELVAQALHDASRLRGEFIPVNCAAIPESLAESVLFGHTDKAFTGATAQPGMFRAANHGTLFLDEVGELAFTIQPKLLRTLQDRTVQPVGATRPVQCNVRVIAATHRPLLGDDDAAPFREDLYARLRELHIAIPPLRARREDVLKLFAASTNPPHRGITHTLAEALLVYRWPRNVRELVAVARELSIMAPRDALLDAPLFLERVNTTQNAGDPEVHPARDANSPELFGFPAIGRAELDKLLREHRGVVAKVAEAVSRSRRQVYRWIEHHKLDVDAYR